MGNTEQKSANRGIFHGVINSFSSLMSNKNPSATQIQNHTPAITPMPREKITLEVKKRNAALFPSVQAGWSPIQNQHPLMMNYQQPWANPQFPSRKSTPSFTELWQEIWETVHEGDLDETRVMSFAEHLSNPTTSNGSSLACSSRYNGTGNNFRQAILPPPVENPSQPVMAFERLVSDVERAATETDLQIVRTSMPPLAAIKKPRTFRVVAMVSVFALFTTVLVLIANSPSPVQDRFVTAAAPSAERPVTQHISSTSAIAKMRRSLSQKPMTTSLLVSVTKPKRDSKQVSKVNTPGKARVEVTNGTMRSPGINTAKISTNAQKKETSASNIPPNQISGRNRKANGALPSRQSVKAAMNRIAPFIRRCGLNGTGRIVVRMSFSGATGGVTGAQMAENSFYGSAATSCVIRAISQAQLPPFQKTVLTIRYPFDL